MSFKLIKKDTSIIHDFVDDASAFALLYHVNVKAYMSYDSADELESSLVTMFSGVPSNISKFPQHLVALPRSSKGKQLSLILLEIGDNSSEYPVEPDRLALHCHRQRCGLSYLIKHKCFTCGKAENVQVCARCRIAHYCGQECQRNAWSVHKKLCKLPKARPERVADASETLDI